jgi:hypothetical protein
MNRDFQCADFMARLTVNLKESFTGWFLHKLYIFMLSIRSSWWILNSRD